MIGLVLDAVLMLLLVAALAYGMRLERRLRALRDGQLAFAGAVTELNAAAGRAEAALASLRASGHETDLLHDRILKARQVKAELEQLVGAAENLSPPPREGGHAPRSERPNNAASVPSKIAEAPPPVGSGEALPNRVKEKRTLLSPEQVQTFTPVLQALAANQAAKQSLNRARRSLDDDLFAA